MKIVVPSTFNIQPNDEYLTKVIEFAEKVPEKIQETLQNSFDRLHQIAQNYKTTVNLFKDFAPYSFYFVIPNVINGGVIYHGPHDNGGNGDFPTFSVNLNSISGWSIHT